MIFVLYLFTFFFFAVSQPVPCLTGKTHMQKLGPLEEKTCIKDSIFFTGGKIKVDASLCCQKHYFCYSTCGLHKSICDEDFATCVKKVCEVAYPQNLENFKAKRVRNCVKAALGFVEDEKLESDELYQNMQTDYCECTDVKSLGIRYKEVIYDFFTEHAFMKRDDYFNGHWDVFVRHARNDILRYMLEFYHLQSNIERIYFDEKNSIDEHVVKKQNDEFYYKSPVHEEL